MTPAEEQQAMRAAHTKYKSGEGGPEKLVPHVDHMHTPCVTTRHSQYNGHNAYDTDYVLKKVLQLFQPVRATTHQIPGGTVEAWVGRQDTDMIAEPQTRADKPTDKHVASH